ncbi:MAG: protein translocase subunit SecF, partial [Ruminococcus sp.]|nr:protein translocase subunit SecF [Ruminococcus sp.]
YVVATIFGLDSVQSFALPMMIGVISGCYSSICIAGPLWVKWQTRKSK